MLSLSDVRLVPQVLPVAVTAATHQEAVVPARHDLRYAVSSPRHSSAPLFGDLQAAKRIERYLSRVPEAWQVPWDGQRAGTLVCNADAYRERGRVITLNSEILSRWAKKSRSVALNVLGDPRQNSVTETSERECGSWSHVLRRHRLRQSQGAIDHSRRRQPLRNKLCSGYCGYQKL